MSTINVYDKNQSFGQDESSIFAKNRIEVVYKSISEVQFQKDFLKTLDIWSGVGYIPNYIYKNFLNQGKKVDSIGLDISDTALKQASEKFPYVTFKKVDISSENPFQDQEFDLVTSFENIEHIYDIDTYLDNINKILKKDGILIIGTPNLNSIWNRFLFMFGKIPLFQEYFLYDFVPSISVFGKTFPDKNTVPSGHIRLLNMTVMKFIAQKYGYEIISVKGAGLFGDRKIIAFLDKMLWKIFPTLSSNLIVTYRKK